MASRNIKLRRLIAPMLEAIDAIQSGRGEPLHLRPLEAANLIVRHSLVSIEGDDDKDDFLEKPWFAAIYAEIHKWYVHRYGSLMKGQRNNVIGLVVHRGLPHVIEVPKTITELQKDGLVKITFPSRLYATEDPMVWIRPRIAKRSVGLGPGRGKLSRRIAETCSALRQICSNTSSAGGVGSNVPLMASSIFMHLGKAAEAASENRKDGNSLALWDIHLACEKSIKSILAQRGIKFPKTHDLARLNALLPDLSLQRHVHRIIRRLPGEKVVIRHRYLQESGVSPSKLYAFYSLALRLCVICTSSIENEVKIADASLFLKQPPWLSQLCET